MEELERQTVFLPSSCVNPSFVVGCHILSLFAYTKFVYSVPPLSPFPQSQDIITRVAPSKILHLQRPPVSGRIILSRLAKRLSAIHHHEFFHIYFFNFLILPICVISYQCHIILLGPVSHKYNFHKFRRRRWGQE